jgi:uncharacterized protein with von Willebrand factor type A (vWA) domain
MVEYGWRGGEQKRRRKKQQAKMKIRRILDMRVVGAKQPMKHATHDSVKGFR